MFKKTLLVAASTLFAVSAVSASAQGPCPGSLNGNAGQFAHHAACQATTSQHFVSPQAPAQHESAVQPVAGLQPNKTQHSLTSVTLR